MTEALPTSAAWLTRLAGKFLVFEGPDGSGKSTQLKRLVDAAAAAGVKVTQVREPGGTPVGEQIRSVLLDPSSTMTLRAEMLLYMASRAQLVETIINPALSRGELVIADRFLTSTFAYQGAGGGLSEQDIRDVGRVATFDIRPDLVLIYYVDVTTATMRTRGVGGGGGGGGGKKGTRPTPASLQGPSLFDDRIEQRDLTFRTRVHESYLAQAKADPTHHALIDASGNAEQVWELTAKLMQQRFGA